MFNRNREDVIKTIKLILSNTKQNIKDEYMAGYYNGLESALSLLENREPEHIIYDEIPEVIKENGGNIPPIKRTRAGILKKR